MKKTFYIILLLFVFVIFAGFKGCVDLHDGAGLQSWYNLHQKPLSANDKETESYAIVVGDSGSVETSEGRPPVPWVPRQSGTTQRLNYIRIYSHPDSTIAFIVGNQGVVLRSTDRGHNWSIIRVPNQNFPNLNGFDIIPPLAPLDNAVGFTNIISVGNTGTVIKSSNSGGNWAWINLSLITTKKFNSIAVVNASLFAVVGDSGAIYRTLDGGANWENRSISAAVSLKKVVSPRYDRYCAVGTNGAIYTSSDYGYSWQPRSSGTTRTFRDVLFSGVDSGCAVGDFGIVRLTTNGGLTWYSDSYLNNLTTKNILCVTRVDENTFNSITTSGTPGDNAADTTFFLAVSSEPFIGIEPISNFVAEVFSLKQNYPNPFNPLTNIEMSIPRAGFVTLVIYDVQGEQIETLVQKEMKPGIYKVDWNASSYPSGVYFYKISSKEFSETKKMILVK